MFAREKPIGCSWIAKWSQAALDLGFDVVGGANTPGATTYHFAKFSPKKLHEIENKFVSLGTPLDPPLSGDN